MWHLLQMSDTLDAEFGSALAERVPLVAWEPVRTWLPSTPSYLQEMVRENRDPPLNVQQFPLIRGFARWPLTLLTSTADNLLKSMLAQTPDPGKSPLVCTVPYFAPVAERWPGPIVYWLTDRIERYSGVNVSRVHKLDQRLCTAATLVCPNSTRLADYLIKVANCSEAKVRILPNATRAANLLPRPATKTGLAAGRSQKLASANCWNYWKSRFQHGLASHSRNDAKDDALHLGVRRTHGRVDSR